MIARRIVIALLVAGAVMLTSTSQRRRSIMKGFSDEVEAVDRYVDIGVTLRVVRADPAGEELYPGSRNLVVLREHYLGGILDTRADPPRILAGDDGISQNPREWFCSEDQERVILHGPSEPVGLAAIGGMGAGKTTAGVMWLYMRWLEHIGERREFGVIGPTEDRLDVVFREMFNLFPAAWYHYSSGAGVLTFADGTSVRGVSTYKQSAKQGSRIQAFNWSVLLADELQDSIDEFINAQARLRSGKKGNKKRLATVTAKDDPAWRTLKGQMETSGIWAFHTMLGPNSPFIDPEHWDALKRQSSERDYRRLVLAEDLPSESRLYHAFNRKVNLRPVPLGARKITSIVLRKKTNDPQDALLGGHDPGSAKSGSVWLDAYELPPAIAKQHGFLPNEVLWWVRGELFTLHATHEQHATQALDITRKRFGCNVRSDAEQVHFRCQPLGSAEDKPDLSVKAIWERVGLRMKFAQYSVRNGQSQGVGQIKKNSRFDMLNTLFCDAAGRSRLFLECDDRGTPATPILLAALETMERDHMGRGEHEEKNVKHDKSDLPAALGYALWPFEKEMALALRVDIRKDLS